MSSHHVIRENQEPAIVFLHPECVRYDIAAQLMEWSPLIIVAEQAFELIHSWNIKIDSIWGSLPFIKKHELEINTYEPIDIINGEEKVFEEFLFGKHVSEVYWFGKKPPLFKNCQVYMINGNEKGFRLNVPGYEKWYPKGTTVRIETNHDGHNKLVVKYINETESEYCFKQKTVLLQHDAWVHYSGSISDVVWETIA